MFCILGGGGLVDSERENSEKASAQGTCLFSEKRKAGPDTYFFLLANFVRAALGWDVRFYAQSGPVGGFWEIHVGPPRFQKLILATKTFQKQNFG